MLFHLFNQCKCQCQLHCRNLYNSTIFLSPYGTTDYERNRTMQHAMSYIIWRNSVALFIRGTYYKSLSAFTAISSLPALKMIKQTLLMLKKKGPNKHWKHYWSLSIAWDRFLLHTLIILATRNWGKNYCNLPNRQQHLQLTTVQCGTHYKM